MGDGDAVDGELSVKIRSDFADLGEGHGFVGFVVEVEGGAAVGLVANAAIEGDDGTVGRGANMADQRVGIDRITNEKKQVCGAVRGHWGSAAADRREEGHFVASVERSVPGGEFPVARSH